MLKSVDIKHRVCIDYYLTAVHFTKWNRYVRTYAKTTVLGGSLPDRVICKVTTALIARITGPTRGPSGADGTQVGPVLAAWTLLSARYEAMHLACHYHNFCLHLVKKITEVKVFHYHNYHISNIFFRNHFVKGIVLYGNSGFIKFFGFFILLCPPIGVKLSVMFLSMTKAFCFASTYFIQYCETLILRVV